MCIRDRLKYLDTFNRERKMVADTYDRELGSIKELTIPERSSFSSHIFHQYTLKCDPLRRDGLIEYLAAKSIPSMVYYPVPLHRQKAYAYLNLKDDGFESTNMLSDCVISLPVHTEMDDEQLSFICSSIKEYFEK
jgi:dTDP-4-amino-4,6-dideoxygalactose transaminase